MRKVLVLFPGMFSTDKSFELLFCKENNSCFDKIIYLSSFCPIIDQLSGFEDADLFLLGHSFGCIPILDFAHRTPDVNLTLILVDSIHPDEICLLNLILGLGLEILEPLMCLKMELAQKRLENNAKYTYLNYSQFDYLIYPDKIKQVFSVNDWVDHSILHNCVLINKMRQNHWFDAKITQSQEKIKSLLRNYKEYKINSGHNIIFENPDIVFDIVQNLL